MAKFYARLVLIAAALIISTVLIVMYAPQSISDLQVPTDSQNSHVIGMTRWDQTVFIYYNPVYILQFYSFALIKVGSFLSSSLTCNYRFQPTYRYRNHEVYD
jgi:hypothetical protein